MIAPVPPARPVSDEQIVRAYAVITITFCAVLMVVGALGAFVLVPDSSVSVRGAAFGVALGMVSWFGSRWVTSSALSRATRPGAPEMSDPTAAGRVPLIGLVVAEFPALFGLPLAFVDGSEVGPLVVAVPIAIAAIVVNVSGPGAVRRHLARLRA